MVHRCDNDAAALLVSAVDEVVDAGPGKIVRSTSTTVIDVDSLALAEIILVYEDLLGARFRESEVSDFVSLWMHGSTLETIAAQAGDGLVN